VHLFFRVDYIIYIQLFVKTLDIRPFQNYRTPKLHSTVAHFL